MNRFDNCMFESSSVGFELGHKSKKRGDIIRQVLLIGNYFEKRLQSVSVSPYVSNNSHVKLAFNYFSKSPFPINGVSLQEFSNVIS